MSGESEGEDEMCDYERQRLENIRKNHNMLRSLGQSASNLISFLVLPTSAKPTSLFYCVIMDNIIENSLVAM